MKATLVLILKIAALTVFVNHFVQTALYVMPSNVLKDGTTLGQVNNAYMRPYFDQVWTLFAPTPVGTDTLLLVQCLPAQTKPRAGDWVDVLGPVWKANQRNRLSAYDRFSRTIENPLRDIVQVPLYLVGITKKCTDGDQAACTLAKKKRDEARTKALKAVRNAASVYCINRQREAHLPFEQVSRIALRIRVVTPPAWRERATGHSTVQDYDLGIHDTARVTSPLIYRGA